MSSDGEGAGEEEEWDWKMWREKCDGEREKVKLFCFIVINEEGERGKRERKSGMIFVCRGERKNDFFILCNK